MEEVLREVELPAPPNEVWELLTCPELLEEWFATDVELEPWPGGEGVFRWGNGEERHVTVERIEPERELVYRWQRGAEECLVELTLAPCVAGTRLRVRETPIGPRAVAGEWATALELRAQLVFAAA